MSVCSTDHARRPPASRTAAPRSTRICNSSSPVVSLPGDRSRAPATSSWTRTSGPRSRDGSCTSRRPPSRNLGPRSGRAAGDVADRRRGRPDRLRRGTRRPHPASAGSLEDRRGAGQRLFGFDRAFGLAVHDGLVAALGRETPIGPALSRGEVRSSAGQLLASLRAIGEPQDVALGGAAVVALTAVQGGALLSVFDAKTGKLRREVAVQAWSRLAERDASGRWVVFHARRRITASTCRAEGSCGSRRRGTPPIGLTVSGRRAAWAEPGGSTSRIRAATLPG